MKAEDLKVGDTVFIWTRFNLIKGKLLQISESKEDIYIHIIDVPWGDKKKGQEFVVSTDWVITEEKYNSLIPKKK